MDDTNNISDCENALTNRSDLPGQAAGTESETVVDELSDHPQKPQKEQNSYRSILKGTSILGGVQFFQILISIVRGKFVAMFLGPAGMGISSLFYTAGQTIQQLSTLGLNIAIVKEVAARKDDENALHTAIAVAKKLLIFTSLLGALVCLLFAMPLSRLTFGSEDYYWQFMLLSVMIFFGVAGQGFISILQGLHKIKLVSATTITGSVIGLVVGVPLYALIGTKGIVPAMAILAFSVFVAALIGVRRAVPDYRGTFEWQSHKPLVKKLITLGMILMASDAIASGCNYLTNLFIRTFGEMANVGLFQAANSLTNQYSGIVFTAMMIDFFPRLSASAADNLKVREIVNRQLEIITLIVCPLICLLILAAPIVVDLLLTKEFMPVVPLLRWLGLGVMVKAVMYPLGYITFAKDNKRLFFWLEGVFCNLLTLGLSCLFFYFYGLIGLGVSLVVDCALCFVVYYVVNARLYGYSLSRKALLRIVLTLALGAGCFASSLITVGWLSYALMAIAALLACVRSITVLRRLIKK